MASEFQQGGHMRGIPRFALALSIALFAAAPATAQVGEETAPPSVELPAELQRVLDDYERAWGARDGAAIAALFHPEGFLMVPGRPPVQGRTAIEAHYRGRGGPLSLRAIAYAMEGDVGWIIGGYSPAPDLPDGGKFSLTLRKGPAGRWLIVTDMDNGNQ